jgi:hypothetical protein
MIKRHRTDKNGFHALSSAVTDIIILKNSKVNKIMSITQNKCGEQNSHNF